MDDFIHLVRSEMLVGAQLLSDNIIEKDKKNRILEVDIDNKKKIAKTWIDVFQNNNY